MKRNGFTLVEILIVIGIIAVLLAISTMQFNAWVRRNQVETQFKQMYADLMAARSQALYNKSGTSSPGGKSVIITTSAFSVYSTTTTGGSVSPVVTKVLKVPVTPTSTRLDFDQSGVATITRISSVVGSTFICDQTNATSALINSLIISQTRIQMSHSNGTGCSDVTAQ